ncbi:hypothetical protein PYCCODRAFT_1374925 [Trametes coccinea BRFM310]|uniref:C3H1-type domain-containing protein n=1 Tax=Trametes coccinea (strain BRFM310) TaxID=1353009 RepID=A0A1Y2IDP0_TRAC3|nr:hypothetical protein PYCCODRAFT_1374925 [Trametes coccinea BRFM310]
MLEDFDRELRTNAARDPGVASSLTQSNPRRGDNGIALDGEPHVRQQRDLLERLSEPPPTKRARSDSGEDSDDEVSPGGEQRARLKRNVDESLFPFIPAVQEESQQLSDDLQRTLVLKENYTRDLAYSKQRVVCSPACPPVPDAIWTDVLANRYVDLDRVFSAIYTVEGDSKSSIKLGDFELTSLPTKPKRHIERHGHWTVAWALYQRAVIFVYPHRERELRAYYDQINGFFAAVSDYEAFRVINLDRAIRGEVGRSNTLLLSDFSRFNHLYTMHVVGAGAATQSASLSSPTSRKSGGTRRTGTSNEACIRFNEGRCTSRNCRYRHVCSTCAARDHVVSSCSQKASGSTGTDRRK